MEDLMVMGNPGDLSGSSGMQLTNLPALRLVNVPRLTHIPSLVISNVTRTSFDFSGLIGAYSIEISGESISDILFTSLAGVGDDLNISSGPGTPLNISLPALQNATSVSITGSLSGLSMPELSGADDTVFSDRIDNSLSINNIDTSGSTIPMAFPKLQACESVELSGAIQSVSLPSLINTDYIYISASQPLSLNFTSLETVNTITLTGNISSFDFPALKSVESLLIRSQLDIDCAPALTAYGLHHSNNANGSYSGSYQCDTTYEVPVTTERNNSLPFKSKLSLGLGFGLGGLAALCLGLCWWSYRKWYNQVKTVGGGEHGIELGNHPPGYVSDGATEVGSMSSGSTAAASFEGQERPPDYDEHVDRAGGVDEGVVSPVSPGEREDTAA
ncbi:hypothetical protein NA56DRAFT_125202 [Hyaloscypha hepaticicola]|uniref:Uncharacterized protein n=1 Tax=Hyaloscypha hepaticicola TaxID=2082293 RepID=A0A2J6Q4Z4_9HELO|nr:hypothetical protein NA56DRAFT_125202 [Hyaloscypha hepaticicola]